MIAVLSIDGGGIRGIIPATFLVEIERRTGKPVCRLFDLIAGTSTGGILAAALSVPGAGHNPKYTAGTIRKAYFEHGGKIFQKNVLRTVTTLGGLTRPIYSPRALEGMLKLYLGDARLHETLTEILVPAYDMTTSTPWFFKTSHAKQSRTKLNDPLLTQVVQATAAAPTYFPPLVLEGHCLFDGGVFASNPALCAYAQARNMYPDEKEIFVVSLGTGTENHSRPCAEVYNWGIANWAVPISGVMLNSSSATVDYQMRALLGRSNYARFQMKLPDAAAPMDDASPENLARLDMIAKQAVKENGIALDRVCERIMRK